MVIKKCNLFSEKGHRNLLLLPQSLQFRQSKIYLSRKLAPLGFINLLIKTMMGFPKISLFIKQQFKLAIPHQNIIFPPKFPKRLTFNLKAF